MKQRVLAVASGGGHWVQMLRLMPALEEHDVAFVTVDPGYQNTIPGRARFHLINDATRWNPFGLALQAARLLRILLREKPSVVISTGAAPGYLALRMGKRLGARTIWLDSVANVEQLSLSGQKVGPHADLWLTQWPHLATPSGPRHEGSVL